MAENLARTQDVHSIVQRDLLLLADFILRRVGQGITVAPINPQWTTTEVRDASDRLRATRVEWSEELDGSHLQSGVPVRIPAHLRKAIAQKTETDDPALIVFTSGSGGEPKPAVLSFRNLLTAAEASSERLRVTEDSRWLLSLPLYHVSGLSILFRALYRDAEVVIPPQDEPLRDSVLRPGLTHVSLVATQLHRLLQDAEATAALARMTAVVLGGGPAPERLVRDALDRGIPLCTSYGMTETAAMIACTDPGETVEHLLSSGRPLRDDTVSITGDGEIRVRGDTLFQGYLQPDGSLQRPLDDDGWFCTGDLGQFDANGFLHVTGRKDMMFITGGENIYPEEIERALCALEGVEEAVVVPVADRELGQRAVAFVQMRDGMIMDPDTISRDLRDALPAYKVPKEYRTMPDADTRTGIKPSRAALQALANS